MHRCCNRTCYFGMICMGHLETGATTCRSLLMPRHSRHTHTGWQLLHHTTAAFDIHAVILSFFHMLHQSCLHSNHSFDPYTGKPLHPQSRYDMHNRFAHNQLLGCFTQCLCKYVVSPPSLTACSQVRPLHRATTDTRSAMVCEPVGHTMMQSVTFISTRFIDHLNRSAASDA